MQGIKRFFLRVFLVLCIIGILAVLIVFCVSSSVKRSTAEDIACIVTGEVSFNQVTQQQLADFDADCILVLGAGIKDEETPSPMLKDRLDVGIELYRLGIAPKLLLSGDNGQVEYN